MNKNEKLIILFLSLLKFILSQDGVISLSFTKEIPNLQGASSKEIILKLSNNKVNVDLRIGTDFQIVKLRLEFESYIFYIKSGSSSNNTNYNEKLSKTYQKMENIQLIFDISNLRRAIFSSDYIYFDKNNDKKYNTTFLLGLATEGENEGGLIGLNLDQKIQYYKYNFFNELKRIGLINDYYFTINYKDNNSGNLIIGDLPHNYDKNYKAENYKDIYVNFYEDDINWTIILNEIYITEGNKLEQKISVQKYTYAYLKLEKSLIEGTENYRKILLNSFLQQQLDKNLCFEEISDIYIFYYCKKEVTISKMKSIYFYNKDLNFTFELTYKDLIYFNKYDGYNYILVVFRVHDIENENEYMDDDFWVLGEPFFKKYQLIFNKNSKRIGLYTNFDNQIIEKKSWIKENKWYIFLIILLIISICGLVTMSFLFFKNKPKRKSKANELNEDFEYISNTNNLFINQ